MYMSSVSRDGNFMRACLSMYFTAWISNTFRKIYLLKYGKVLIPTTFIQLFIHSAQMTILRLTRLRLIFKHRSLEFLEVQEDHTLRFPVGFLRSDNDAKPLGPNVWCETALHLIICNKPTHNNVVQLASNQVIKHAHAEFLISNSWFTLIILMYLVVM